MSDTERTDDIVDVPEGLSEDEIVEFIRKAIRDRGGDPDTARLISADWMEGNQTHVEGGPLVQIDLSKLSPDWRSLYEGLSNAYHDDEGADDVE